MPTTPFNLPPNFGIAHLQAFLNDCAANEVSDIVFQTGDVVWGEIKGRQARLTTRRLQDGEMRALLGLMFGNELIGIIRGSHDADRAYRFVSDNAVRRYRINVSAAQIGDAEEGISITMRTIPETPPALASLKLPIGIEKNLFQPQGLVLICGPTGSGKTTLMSSFYAWVSENDKNAKILLYEDPIEFLFSKVQNIGPRIRQMQIRRHISSFARGIRNALRCKPTLIGIGEARDVETINAMIEAALTGHGTYGTLHTQSVSETISRAIQTFPAEQHTSIASKLLGALRLIVVQILLPTLNGERMAVREWLYFDREVRRQMSEMPHAQWGAFLRQIVMDKKQDMTTGLRTLLDRCLIDEQTFRCYAGEEN